MLNQTGVKKMSYGNVRQILFTPQDRIGLSIFVDASTYVEEGGRKLVKAGTPMSGDLRKRDVVFTVTGAADTPVGVLEHDVDVTLGEANGSLVVFGGVNLARYDDTTKAMITDDIVSKLPRIIFIDEP